MLARDLVRMGGSPNRSIETASQGSVMSNKSELFTEIEYKEYFNHIDRNKSGKIGKPEISQFMLYLVRNQPTMQAKSEYMLKLN